MFIEFLAASQNLPFTVALAVMFGIAILEGAMMMIGVGMSNAIESIMPDMDFDFDTDLSMGEVHSPFSRLLSWLRIGKVPVIMLLVVFLTAFGLIGLAIQSFLLGTAGFLSPGLIASVPAFVLALPVVRVFGGLLSKLMPNDETEVVSHDSLVGMVAVIILGDARKQHSAEARVKDKYGTTHYVRVEPDNIEEEFKQGESVLLVRRAGSIFTVIKNTNPSLSDG